jgi:hypothetical protein
MGQYLAAVKRELLASVNGLSADARFQVIFYNRRPMVLELDGGSGLVSASDENKRRVDQQIAALQAEGGTEHLAALRQALSLQPDAIFFLTDADDLTPQEVNTITQLNRGGSAIHTFEMVPRRQADLPLQLLARRNRGTYRAVELR